MTEPLLEAEDLTIQYRTERGPITAVSGASFRIEKGEYFGLVGESGCGKSTIARAIIGGLDDNGHIESGQIRYRGKNLHDMTQDELNNEIRWKEISLIPQSSMNSLDPLRRISKQAIELAEVHTDMGNQEALSKLRELFETVGLQENRIKEYPHQFSGGMQQRAIIAMALLLNPSLIIADEPTTALDVIMQDQVFKYLEKIKDERNASMMLITHDISLVFESCQSMAVMHAGQVAESGSTRDVLKSPCHPYSILLQEAFPDIRHPNRELGVIEGIPPQNLGSVDYCTFADRCPWVVEECQVSSPSLEPADGGTDQHQAACFRKESIPGLYQESQHLGGEQDD